MSFKKNFIWGAATASYQVEGAAHEDGRKPSVWDECAHRPGFVKANANGDVACDHYHRMEEDVKLMSQMGVQAYRFSVSWSRVIPDGIGEVNKKGMDFYDRLVDKLLENKIEPFLTLFHWDYPLELYYKGGWLNPDSSKWFEEYAERVCDALSDRVSHWITLNEPQCFIDIGHRQGTHAPGIQLPFNQLLLAAHNVLLAHGKAVSVLRSKAKKPPVIGFAPVGSVCIPHTESDIELAREEMFKVGSFDLFSNTWWADPIFFGSYPSDGLKLYERFLPAIGSDDMKTISQPVDFYGVNIYQGKTVTVKGSDAQDVVDPYGDITAFDWPVTPQALYWGPKFLYERYKKPIYITENGLAGTDFVNKDGKILDDHRIVYTEKYLHELKKAASDGVDIAGYFHWSLLDNFEWAEGYTKRFGLVHVDYRTGNRTPKASAEWYKKVIESNFNQ